MADWIPDTEAAFENLVNQYVPPIVAAPTTFGLVAADGTRLGNEQYLYVQAQTAVENARAALAAALQTRDALRAVLEADLRSTGARIQANPAVTDAQRETVGLPVHKTSRTPAPVPTTAPVLAVDAGRRLEHIISWRDSATPTSKARPAGVSGLELFIKIGTAPTSVDDCRALGMITRSPNLEEFSAADGGKTAYYIGRWVNTRGDHGPTSDIASATIAAQT